MEEKTAKVKKVLNLLNKEYPAAPDTYLNYSNPYEMLIATILSAQTTDECVNTVTPALFDKYPDAENLADAAQDDVIEIIRRCGKYNVKSDYIIRTAKMLVEDLESEIPRTIKDMVKFPGVSRKTANVVLSVVFGINEGIVVDTHVGRVSKRLGFTEEKNAKKIEKDLMEIVPENKWQDYARLLGAHGRRTCEARSPKCPECILKELCPSAEL